MKKYLIGMFYKSFFMGSGEILGWASAQVVCICSINPQKVLALDSITKTSAYQASANSTSLSPSRGERGLVIFSTTPKILVCDLKLSDGSHTNCMLSS